MKILIVDSDQMLAKNVKYSMQQDDYSVVLCDDTGEALKRVKSNSYDIVLTDIEMQQKQDFTFIQDIRRVSDIPIIVISKNNEDINKILALEYGADDYVVKPFNILELKARIKAIKRRQNTEKQDHNRGDISFDDYQVKTLGRVLVKGDEVIPLTGKEFDLLYVLSSNAGKIFTREELMSLVWGYEFYGDLRSVDVHVRRVRRKIEPSTKHPKYIHTKYGTGYFFKIPED
ncbi:MAG: response regulator transcription factor [Tissierellia bacterium]|nr:response regulator transcription factor [Tissierellia bacterium]